MPKRWLCWIGVAVCSLGILQSDAPRIASVALRPLMKWPTRLSQRSANTDEADWRAILGPEAVRVIELKGPDADQRQIQEFLALYDEKHAIDRKARGRAELNVGPDDWPLPIPIIESHGRWTFDTSAGAQSIIDRRIGRNELSAIRTLLACVDAQHEYFELSELATGTGVYATRLVSTPGHQDGLYWPATEDGTESPLGRLIDGVQEAGFPDELDEDEPIEYEGYYFRILKAQGPNADGGAKSYIESGHMTGGFALIAWPAEFEFKRDNELHCWPKPRCVSKRSRPHTLSIAAAVTTFDPDLTWSRIELTTSEAVPIRNSQAALSSWLDAPRGNRVALGRSDIAHQGTRKW